MAKKQIVVVNPPKIEVDYSDIRKLIDAIGELSDVRSLLDDINDCSDDLKTIGFLAGKAYTILDKAESILLDTIETINIKSENDDNDTN